jgi:hypothetical protein
MLGFGWQQTPLLPSVLDLFLSDVSVGLATNRTRYVSHAQGQHQKCGQTIVGRVVNRSGYAFVALWASLAAHGTRRELALCD